MCARTQRTKCIPKFIACPATHIYTQRQPDTPLTPPPSFAHTRCTLATLSSAGMHQETSRQLRSRQYPPAFSPGCTFRMRLVSKGPTEGWPCPGRQQNEAFPRVLRRRRAYRTSPTRGFFPCLAASAGAWLGGPLPGCLGLTGSFGAHKVANKRRKDLIL